MHGCPCILNDARLRLFKRKQSPAILQGRIRDIALQHCCDIVLIFHNIVPILFLLRTAFQRVLYFSRELSLRSPIGYSTTGARFSCAKAPSDCVRVFSFPRLLITSSCSESDSFRLPKFSAATEVKEMFSHGILDVPQAVQFCSVSWF